MDEKVGKNVKEPQAGLDPRLPVSKMRTRVRDMKLSVFLLVALLALCSAVDQDTEEQNSTTEEDFHLNPALGNIIPKIKVKRSLPAPPAHMSNRIRRYSSTPDHGSALEWQTYHGSVPSGAVQVYISYTKRYDYVCKYGCQTGFFNPRFGSYCHYPYAEKEHKGHPFEILVNKDNFERLEWKGGSWGGVPANSVKTCAGRSIYVGKNKYGLGKVHVGHKTFFLPWQSKEYWYKVYEYLTINKNFGTERMHNVKYDTSNAKITEHPPEVLRQSSIINNECRSVEKTAQLSRTFQEEKRWDSSTSLTVGATRTITAEIPSVGSAGVTLSTEATSTLSRGSTVMKSTTYSVSIKQNVPPNHSCSVSMVGRKYKAEIPFTATLTRTYKDGTTRSRSISGTFTGTNVGGIHSVVDRCEPLPNADPCP
ncbi:natterin-3-like [Cheilinus undulatus]|uniref:natterin-3-like n=1 Tax=Cheilinus undulatus TaxID=241271 RepID=UPI001BD48F8E|nr:natterin-3-like [Cheilinus undulatus]